MNQTVVRIPSKLYHKLWETGNLSPGLTGDKLIAVYAILKSSRGGSAVFSAYTSKNNKRVGGYSLLRQVANVSLTTLQKYVPVLLELGLCHFNDNGDFVFVGNNKLKEVFNRKLVPIVIGKSLVETSYNVISVRLHAAHSQQTRQIGKKRKRSEILKQGENPFSQRMYKKAKRLKEKYGDSVKVTDKAVLSIQGYAKLKDGSLDKKSKGAYWKTKLCKLGMVSTKRRFSYSSPMSYNDFQMMKKYDDAMPSNVIYKRKGAVVEYISTFSPISLLNKKSGGVGFSGVEN